MEYLKAESLKIKNTTLSRLPYLLPIAFVLLGIPMASFMYGGAEGPYFMLTVFNMMSVFVYPILIGVFCYESINMEKKSRLDSKMASLYMNKGAVLKSKIYIITRQCFITVLFLTLLVGLTETFLFKDAFSIVDLGRACATLFLTSLTPIALTFAIGLATHPVVCIVVGTLSGLVSAWAAPRAIWYTFPWAWLSRGISPILKLHPNATILPAESELLSKNIPIQCIAISVIASALITGLIVTISTSGANCHNAKVPDAK